MGQNFGDYELILGVIDGSLTVCWTKNNH